MASKKKKRPTPPPPPVARKAPRVAGRPDGPTPKQLQRQAAEKQARSEALRRKVIAGALVVAALAAIGGYVVQRQRSQAELRDALQAGSCTVDTEADRISGGDGHVTAPTYTVNPPAGGDHLAAPARGGVYSGTSVPPDGQVVHSMEHGYVIAWHAPDLPAPQLNALKTFEKNNKGDVLVVERDGMPTPFAATAWNQRLLCDGVEAEPLTRFFDEYVGKGPEDVARG